MKPTVLVVADAERAGPLRDAVRAAGHPVAVAGTLELAMRKAAEFSPPLALVDVGLPGPPDGFEVARQLRARLRVGLIAAVGLDALPAVARVDALEPLATLTIDPSSAEMETALALAAHRHARSRVERPEAALLAAFEQIDAALVLTHVTGAVVRLNPAAEALTGWPAAEAAGREYGEVVALSDPATGQPVECPAARRQSWDAASLRPPMRALLRRRDGARVPVHVSLTALAREDRKLSGLAFVLRPAADAARSGGGGGDAPAVLAQVVAALHHSTTRLKGQARLLGSHLRDGSPDAARSAADALAEAFAFQCAWVERLAEAVAVGAGRSGPADVLTTVRDAEPGVRLALGSAATLAPGPAPGPLPPVSADGPAVARILALLAENARHAMPAGGTLTLTVGPPRPADRCPVPLGGSLAPGDYVPVTLIDTGSGMSAQTLSRAGRPLFSTRPPSAERPYGLGLPAAAALAASMGGGVALESAVGRGTTATLLLRVRRPGPANRPIALVLDDESDARARHADWLADAGYDARPAATPGDALTLALDDPARVRLVVAPWPAPLMPTRDLVAELARAGASPAVVVLATEPRDWLLYLGMADADWIVLGREPPREALLAAAPLRP